MSTTWKREFLIFRRLVINCSFAFYYLITISIKLIVKLLINQFMRIWGQKNNEEIDIEDPVSEGHIFETTFVSERI